MKLRIDLDRCGMKLRIDLDRCGMKLRIDLHIILLSQRKSVNIGAVNAALHCRELMKFRPTFCATDQSHKIRENRCRENHPLLRGVNEFLYVHSTFTGRSG